MTRNEAHRQVFPDLRVDTSNHANDFFRTNQGGAFYAFGMDGGASGRRGDLVVIEDPIRNLQDALSETVQHELYNIYKGVIKDRLRPGGKILFIMTRWAVRDLAARILEDEGRKWKVLVIPAQIQEPDGPYLWESHFGRDRYQEAKQDTYLWNAKWQQNPTPLMNQSFKLEWLRFYLPEGHPPEFYEDGSPKSISVATEKMFRLNTYIFVDPALGKGAQHDRTCILVLAAGPERRLFLVDGVLDRLDPTERINHLVRLVRLWSPKSVAYEEYGMVSDTHFLQKRFEEEGIELQPISVGRKGIKGMDGGRLRKHDRLIQLIPDFRDGRIWLPKKMVRTLLDGTKFDIIRYAIEREILPYAGDGSVAHDEFLDTLSRIHDSQVFIEYTDRDDADADDVMDDYAGAGGSWEVQ